MKPDESAFEAAREAIIAAAREWRSAPNVTLWRPACEALMNAVDGLIVLEMRRDGIWPYNAPRERAE